MYKTGGGIDETNIKASLKLLYDKISSLIRISVLGLEPSEGDSDVFTVKSQKGLSQDIPYFHNNNIIIEYIDEETPTTSTPELLQEVQKEQKDFPKQPDAGITGAAKSTSELKTIDKAEDTPQLLSALEEKNDWSDYTPKKLQSKKYRVLQVKRKRDPEQIDPNQNGTEKKTELVTLKKKLLEEESARNITYHQEKSQREEELHLLKVKNLKLQNQKLEMEILLLKKQLNT
ncbi:unnamed protein product [Ceutorhynchus assimilis]|uniref:Uncharacterized protein n=1 Tax=Ceutorhynchus assimilis TaxID=467358 RepID=A0A9N9MD88_9CUCU|nr:unnamed protein product [Ceutorhynchus assimilis]